MAGKSCSDVAVPIITVTILLTLFDRFCCDIATLLRDTRHETVPIICATGSTRIRDINDLASDSVDLLIIHGLPDNIVGTATAAGQGTK